MISITETSNDMAHMALHGKLTIYVAKKFHKDMDTCLNKYKHIDVDMSEVSELDTTCYQILLRAKLLSLMNNQVFNVGNLSDESQQIFDLHNLGSVFNHSEFNAK